MRETGYRPDPEPMSLDQLDDPTRRLVGLAAAIAVGAEPGIERAVGAAREGGVPVGWIDELLLQSVLICGWPRALTAGRVVRQAGVPVASSSEDAGDYRKHGEWKTRGESTCQAVYGESYPALRRNIRALHPALEAAMILEGYGRILGRPALDLPRRELCIVAQIAVLGARRQLRSHLKGALRTGAAPAVVVDVLEQIRPLLSREEWTETWLLWERVRP
jgi:4-carboxymuconolactone decarboxylase